MRALERGGAGPAAPHSGVWAKVGLGGECRPHHGPVLDGLKAPATHRHLIIAGGLTPMSPGLPLSWAWTMCYVAYHQKNVVARNV